MAAGNSGTHQVYRPLGRNLMMRYLNRSTINAVDRERCVVSGPETAFCPLGPQ
jgi:hypothetical protein